MKTIKKAPKKAMMGSTMMPKPMMEKPMMKQGGKLKPVNKAKNPGLAKLPTPVRNKMGFKKYGGDVDMMQAGGVVKSQPKRVGPVDPKGAYTKVQERNLPPRDVKTKVSLSPNKQLGATKMMKKGGDVAKKSVIKKAQLGSSINPRIDSRVKRINEKTDRKVENYETRVGKKYMKDPSSLPAPGRSREVIDKGNEKVAKIRRRANAKRGW